MKTASKILSPVILQRITAALCLLMAFSARNALAQATSVTTVRSTANPSYYGESGVTFTATVAGGGATPTGTVQFLTNGVNFGSAVTLSGGSATSLALPTTLPAGGYTVTAAYSGDGTYAPSSGGLPSGSTFTSLYGFTGETDGASPYSSLVLSGNTLYGTAYYGGSFYAGSIFSVNTDGTGFATLYAFTNGADGRYPYGQLFLSGNTLYGTAYEGGHAHYGTVFSINIDGAGFTNLYSFTNGADGRYPYSGVILSGGALYGTAYQGGHSHNGTVFSLKTNGTGFANLHAFTGADDGASPYGGLMLSGNTLYGTASEGGFSYNGTLYSLTTNGADFATLYSFTGDADGGGPESGLILSGSTLFGTASYGGISGEGSVFSVATNGSDFATLYSFTGGADGAYPYCTLVLSGNTLYGTAYSGGASMDGTVFSVVTNGTGFAAIYSFTNGADGASPNAGLIQSGDTFYGTASEGGSVGSGTVFDLQLSSGQQVVSRATPLITTLPNASALIYGQALSNSVLSGGAADTSGTFAFTSPATVPGTGANSESVTFTPADLTDYTTAVTNVIVVVNAKPPPSITAAPSASPLNYGQALSNSVLSGGSASVPGTFAFTSPATVPAAGTNSESVTFTPADTNDYGTATTNVSVVVGQTNSAMVLASSSNPSVYGQTGVTFQANVTGVGVAPTGTVQFQTNGVNFGAAAALSGGIAKSPALPTTLPVGNYTVTAAYSGDGNYFPANGALPPGLVNLYVFTNGVDGADPLGNLVLAGGTLYGTTSAEGASSNNYGTIFSINTNGTGFTILYTFTNGADGSFPCAGLVLSGATLYGTASGEAGTSATIFSISTNGAGFATLHRFTNNTDGYHPMASLVLSGYTLYGTAASEGSGGSGTVFSLTTNGTGFTILHSFTTDIIPGTDDPGTNADGAYPEAGLILSGNTLYGTALEGGSSNYGTIFSVTTNGTAFTTLYNFTNGVDGAGPQAAMILLGSTLYGTASGVTGGRNGAHSDGTVFSITTNGTGFTVVHGFNGSDGEYPEASLFLSGTNFYGTTFSGGSKGSGTAFSVATNGSAFNTLYNFAELSGGIPGYNYGGRLQSGLLQSGFNLFGASGEVGGYGYGTVFGFEPVQQVIEATPSFSGLAASTSITYGTTNVVLTGKVGEASAAAYPAQGETISVTINGNTQTTTIDDSTGDFAINFTLPVLPASSNSLPISYSYAGDSGFSSASNGATSLKIVPAPVTVISGLAANSKIYDRTTTATLTSNNVVLAGIFGGGAVALNTNGYIANFAQAAPGSNIAVIVSGMTLGGASASNYVLIQPTNLAASITVPTLQFSNNFPNLVFSWPTNLTGFVLSQTTNLSQPSVWSPVTNGIAVIGTNNTVTFAVGTNAEQFFALIAAP